MGKIIAIMLVIIFGSVFVELMIDPLDDALTVATTDVESVTTGAAETTGSITLISQHWHNDETSLAVSCATDAAPGFTLAGYRVTVNLTGLTVGTTQDCTTNFLAETDEDFSGIAKLLPLFITIATLGAVFLAVGLGVSQATGKQLSVGGASLGGSGGIGLSQFVVLLVGVILIPTINDFVNDAQLAYSIVPEYVGVGALLDLVVIGFVLAIISLGVGGAIGKVRG